MGKDAPEAGFVLLILLPDPCLQGPQLSANHRRQGRVELQHLGKVSLGLLGIPHSSMGLTPLEVSLDIVCGDTRKQKAASGMRGAWPACLLALAHHGESWSALNSKPMPPVTLNHSYSLDTTPPCWQGSSGQALLGSSNEGDVRAEGRTKCPQRWVGRGQSEVQRAWCSPSYLLRMEEQ